MSALAPFKRAALRDVPPEREKTPSARKSTSIAGMFKMRHNKVTKDDRCGKVQSLTKKGEKRRGPKPPPHALSVAFNGRFDLL